MGWVAIPSPGKLPDPGIEPGSPVVQVDSLPAELPGKPFNTYRIWQKETVKNKNWKGKSKAILTHRQYCYLFLKSQ